MAYLLIGKSVTPRWVWVTLRYSSIWYWSGICQHRACGRIVLPLSTAWRRALGSERKSRVVSDITLMMSIYMVTKTTSYMSFTAMAGNIWR
ncbi:hypothetical protein ACVXHA_14205 [Escherichia coli]